jgi:hypothetical protein
VVRPFHHCLVTVLGSLQLRRAYSMYAHCHQVVWHTRRNRRERRWLPQCSVTSALIAPLEPIGTAKDDNFAVVVRESGDDGRQYNPEDTAFQIIFG